MTLVPQANQPIAPPFTLESATLKVRLAEDAWNSRDPDRVALAYSEDSQWRNRSEFVVGREQIRRFQYEWHDASGGWFRSYGNELWEFDEAGLMRRREASINDIAITELERRFRWASPGNRPIGQGDTSQVR